MSSVTPPLLWQPDPERIAQAKITQFQAWAAEHHGAPVEGGYAALHRWSVDELDTFWRAVVEWFDVRFSTPYRRVLGDRCVHISGTIIDRAVIAIFLHAAPHLGRPARDSDRAATQDAGDLADG